MPAAETPSIFQLMLRLTAQERFTFGQKRKLYLNRPFVEEALIEDHRGWKLVYARKGIVIGELRLGKVK